MSRAKQKIPIEEEEEIIERLKNGESITAVSKDMKRSRSTISKYARLNNVKLAHSIDTNVNEARSYFSKRDRMDLLKKGFEKAAWLLQQIQNTREYKDWSMGTAILIDKQRLEEGEPTAINDSNIRSNNTIKIKPEELTAEKKKEIAERYMNETIGI